MEEYTRKINYYETDRMAIVHNSNYIRFFEEARLDHLEKSGINYLQMEMDGILIPQTEAHIKYGASLKYGDVISVRTRLTKFNGIVMQYDYEIYISGNAKPAATGYTRHCFVDNGSRFPQNIRKRMPEVYEKMLLGMDI